MGRIRNIIRRAFVREPMLNRRMTVDLCENVHLHYRNLRLEFPKEEFLFILRALKSLDEEKIENFPYAPDAWEEILHTTDLPKRAEHNHRLQVEEQMEGHYHLHYRNLRIEAFAEQHLEWLFASPDDESKR
ncbi:MAG: hypothetical protein O3A46_01560 [Candidatus Poribacteria bacterium]|nr:hypothetical protein [Candidatus Poribacteria bacterium]